MKKLALMSLAVLPLFACSDSNKVTAEDFAVVDAVVKSTTLESIVATGPAGDIVVSVPATDELLAVYAKEKTSKFVSADLAPVLAEGNCYIDIDVKYNTYRLFCGAALPENAGAEDGFYAVVMQIPTEQAATQPTDAPVEQPADAPAVAE